MGRIAMHGLMQDWPLRIPRVLDHAAEWHGEREIVSCMLDGTMHRYGYRDLHRRARMLANALVRLGLRRRPGRYPRLEHLSAHGALLRDGRARGRSATR